MKQNIMKAPNEDYLWWKRGQNLRWIPQQPLVGSYPNLKLTLKWQYKTLQSFTLTLYILFSKFDFILYCNVTHLILW